MKNFIVLGLVLVTSTSTFAQDLSFKDENFLKAVLELGTDIDANGDHIIQKSEADSVKKLRLMEKNIASMEDAYLFPNIEELILTRNQIKEVHLEGLSKLRTFYCAVNPVTFAIIKNLPNLVDITFNFCTTLDSLTIENLPNLENFSANENKLRYFDPTVYAKLKHLALSDNKITTIDITKNPELIQLMIDGNPIKELDIRNNAKIKTHILYIDKTVKIIATSVQKAEIKKRGTASKGVEMSN